MRRFGACAGASWQSLSCSIHPGQNLQPAKPIAGIFHAPCSIACVKASKIHSDALLFLSQYNLHILTQRAREGRFWSITAYAGNSFFPRLRCRFLCNRFSHFHACKFFPFPLPFGFPLRQAERGAWGKMQVA